MVQIGDTVGKKNTGNSDVPADIKQQVSQGNSQSANGLNSIPVEKKQSTLSSWWSKKAGERLTDEEKNLQKGIGYEKHKKNFLFFCIIYSVFFYSSGFYKVKNLP